MKTSGHDHEFKEIVSPLASNSKLNQLVSAFATRSAELEHSDVYDSETSDRHFDEVERLTDYLGHQVWVGGFDRWDWAAMFVSDEEFRDLYPSDRHWVLDDFIKDDVAEFIADQNWEELARTKMTVLERENLIKVLSHFDVRTWGLEMLHLQRLIAS